MSGKAQVVVCICLATGLMGGRIVGGAEKETFKCGLTVRDYGVLCKDGKSYRGIGVNCFDVFLRVLQDPCDVSYQRGFKTLAKYKIPFVRFNCGGMWATDLALYTHNKKLYFELLGKVVRAAEENGIGLIPSLFWRMNVVPDLVGESCDQWGNSKSKTHQFMREYTREVIVRYLHSPAMWGWEFGNEYNLRVDLPNAAKHRPSVVPRLGTPKSRSERDDLTRGMVQAALTGFAQEVRKYDVYRMISSGNSLPRKSAWHQRHEKSWGEDSTEQNLEMLLEINPDPINTLSVHIYNHSFERAQMLIEQLHSDKKPLFVGEFGAKGKSEQTKKEFYEILRWIEVEQVDLAALWVFDYTPQVDYNVDYNNERAYQLDAIAKANKRLWKGQKRK